MTPPTPTPEKRLSEEEKADIYALAGKATPGPWQAGIKALELTPLGIKERCEPGACKEITIHTAWNHGQLGGPSPIVTTACGPYYEPTTHVYIRREDADYIAAADPTTMRALLAELAAKERELAEAKAALAAMPAPFKADEGVTQRLLLGTTTDAVRFVVSLFDVPFTSDMIIESLRRRKRLSETAVRSELLRMSSVGLLRREQKPGKRGREWVYQHAPVADVERADHEEHKRMIAGYDGSDSYSDADVPKAPVADGQAQGEDGGEEKTTK